MVEKETCRFEVTGEQFEVLQRMIDSEEVEEMSLRMGEDYHREFIDLRNNLHDKTTWITE